MDAINAIVNSTNEIQISAGTTGPFFAINCIQNFRRKLKIFISITDAFR